MSVALPKKTYTQLKRTKVTPAKKPEWGSYGFGLDVYHLAKKGRLVLN